jgi:hypothetical protein
MKGRRDGTAEAGEFEMIRPLDNHTVSHRSAIQGSLPGGFELYDSVPVDVWQEGPEYVAAAPDLDVHAFGATEDEALTNLRAQLVEQFRRLEDLGDHLAPRMVAQRDRLRHALSVVHA